MSFRSPVLVTAVGALAFVGGYLTGRSAAPGAAPTPAVTRIAQTRLAVLPFDSWSEDPRDDEFSDSLTREIMTMLTQEGVRVAPYAAIEQFKSQVVRDDDIRRIADRLGATAVALGTVTREADGATSLVVTLLGGSGGERVEALSRISVRWLGPRTCQRALREQVVPHIVETLNQ
jgi:TolB-like protein